jgi:hypothetical protein
MADYIRSPMPDLVRVSGFLGKVAARARLAMRQAGAAASDVLGDMAGRAHIAARRAQAVTVDGLQAASEWIAERKDYYSTRGWCGAPLGAAGVFGILAYFDNAQLIALVAGLAAGPASLAVFLKVDEPARRRLEAAMAEWADLPS